MCNIAAATKDTNPKDTMVIDAIDHIATCIADSIRDLPEEDRDKRRIEIIKSFAEGLLLKAKQAETMRKEPAEKSINFYMSYVRPTEEERKSVKPIIQKIMATEEATIEEKRIIQFQERLVNSVEKGGNK